MTEQLEELIAHVDQCRQQVRVAGVGLASWDRIMVVERFPAVGSYAIVQQTNSSPGGTTANSAVTLARLGAEVRLAALVGDDVEGETLREVLHAHGVDTTWVKTARNRPTDKTFIVSSNDPSDRTVFWQQGARLALGDQLDITSIFAHDVVIVDLDDELLRRFLVDLPAHTLPQARLLGTLTYVSSMEPTKAIESAVRFDVIVGNEQELKAIFEMDSLDNALAEVQRQMYGQNLRVCVVTRGANGSTAVTREERWNAPAFEIDAVDTTGAGDAFTGAVAFACARRWSWPLSLRFANAVAALSTRSLGAQTALPTLSEVATLMGVTEESLRT